MNTNQHDIRKLLENREDAILSEWGFKTSLSKGRKTPEPDCPVRLAFQRDRDRIIHSKAFRRLKHKTQVFLAPEGDHFRTRLTHTLEVTQIARTIGRALGLNEDLIEAVGLGHDLGHTPFGHAGEKVLDEWCKKNGRNSGFQHHIQSVRVVEVLENEGAGLNLSAEVIEGILKHTKGRSDYSLNADSSESLHWEGRVVKISDRIAYVNHDLQDAFYSGLITPNDVPDKFFKFLGESNRDRISSMVNNVVNTTLTNGVLSMSDEMSETINDLKNWLFENVYYHPMVRSFDKSIHRCLFGMMDSLMSDDEEMEKFIGRKSEISEERLTMIVDYVAGMTDHFAIRVAKELLLPTPWPI